MGGAGTSPAVVRFGPFELDGRTGELRKGADRVKIPSQSVEILKALLERPGDLVTREELRERLWPSDTFVDFEHGLNAAVRRLREALGDSADSPIFVETLPRRGYRFIGALEASALVNDTAARPAETRPTSRSAGRLRAVGPVVAVCAVVVVVAVAMRIAARRHSSAAVPDAPRATQVPVTTLPGWEYDPAISPDGNHVAFAWRKAEANGYGIYVAPIEGGEPLRLTSDAGSDREPAWSPDGKQIAFLRKLETGGSVVVVIPALGGAERRLDQTRASNMSGPNSSNGLSWTPDGRSVVFTDAAAASGALAIFASTADGTERTQLTFPPRDLMDVSPRISPDGRHLAFVRRNPGTGRGHVFEQPLDGLRPVGAARPLTDALVAYGVDWWPDSTKVVHDSGDSVLWRVSLAGGAPEPLLTPFLPNRLAGLHPSVARDGSRVLFQVSTGDMNVWRIPGLQPDRTKGTLDAQPVRLIASTAADSSASFSPDGSHIAFISSRSGNLSVWTSDRDGSKALQVTSFTERVGSPRWNPDGTAIAFDSLASGTWNVYVVGAQGGAVRAVTNDPSNNVRPTWSVDGRWIYFASTRSGPWEVWKVPAAGGDAVQVTKGGGFEAFESLDGQRIYYTKAAGIQGVWQLPLGGGAEAQVIDHGGPGRLAVTNQGLFVLDTRTPSQPVVGFFPYGSDRATAFLDFPAPQTPGGPEFHVSRDGRWILYTTVENPGSDIAMLKGIR